MKIAIHQPNFLPWTGYFHKISKSDIFVFLDDVQYSKNSFINRNRIKSPDGVLWLTVPVGQKNKFGQSIKDVEIINSEKNLKKVLYSIKVNYSRAKHFNELYPLIESVISLNINNNLSSLNIQLIEKITEYLNLNTEFVKASNLDGITGTSTERLVTICKKLGAKKYISGFGGNKYQDVEMFNDAKIKCETYDFVHPVYQQLWGDYVPNLSIIDYLFNNSPKELFS